MLIDPTKYPTKYPVKMSPVAMTLKSYSTALIPKSVPCSPLAIMINDKPKKRDHELRTVLNITA